MGYCEDDSMVRVDFFRPSGKWYCTEAVKWLTFCGMHDQGGLSPVEAFVEALASHLGKTETRMDGMLAVCLHPYHQFAHPVSIIVGGPDWKSMVNK